MRAPARRLELVARVETLAGWRPGGRVLDLFAGAGNFALPLSARSDEVVAVEQGAEAFGDLLRNVAANGIGNVRAVRSPVERFRPSGRFAAVVVYVSCDPATLARDLSRLSGLYRVAAIEAYDFFPQTPHVETLAVLERLQ